MADTYGIEFPLLQDVDLTLAKAYAGVSTDGFPLPAVFVLNQDSSVFFQRIGGTTHDRVYVSELLSIVDRMLGVHDLPTPKGYEFANQVRAGGGLGAHAVNGDNAFAADLELAALRSFGSYFAFGAMVGSELLADRELRAAALLRARLPYWHGVGELYLQMPLGVARRFADDEFRKSGLYSGLTLGTESEISPQFFVFADLKLGMSVFASDISSDRVSKRVTFQAGLGWKF